MRQEPVTPISSHRVRKLSESLDICAGDVLRVQGSGRLADIGVNAGLMGHVCVALAPPRLIGAESLEAQSLQAVWPAGAVEVWSVAAVECTRSHTGLHRCELLIRREPHGGKLLLIGELAANEEERCVDLSPILDEHLEVWQSPAELRADFRHEIMALVLRDMDEHKADWSFSTAARAVFKSAALSKRRDQDELRSSIESYWESPPICTSIVISFWQRYLREYAQTLGCGDVDLILKFMPLKADRVLPSELINTMQQCGWVRVRR